MGFGVLASVPHSSAVYPLLGRPHDSLDSDSEHYAIKFPQYLGAQYDASTTNLTYSIPSPSSANGSVEVILSFLSPITPTSTLRQSIPASYVTAYVKGNFDINIYIDVNGQWVSGNRGSHIEWELHENQFQKDAEKLKTWKVRRSNEELFTEWQDRAEWGTLHFTGPGDAPHECGTSAILRQRFAKSGALRNAVDDSFREIMDSEPVFAFSKSFKLGTGKGLDAEAFIDSVMFTITHIQDPVTQFASARGLTMMRPLWMSYFYSDTALISFHYGDFRHAFTLAADYSRQVAKDAFASGSTNYQEIVELSARQVMGATVFSGTPDNPILFLKEISSNGNCQTVDVIFPAFPFFLYTNPKWLAYLLEPLIEHMLSGQYPNDYTMHDLGTHFPNMTGHSDGNDEYMPVEECGDMLIMGLALVNSLSYASSEEAGSPWSALGNPKDVASMQVREGVSPFALPDTLETRDGIFGLDDQWGGTSSQHQAKQWVSRSYRLWKQWTGYLVDYSLYPQNQLCTDDFAGWLPLMTNLALKGIVGIKAMSELAEVVGETADAKYYRNVSEEYVKVWELEGMARDSGRAKLAYNWEGSWTTLYSLYADALLCFHPTLNATPSVLESGGKSSQKPMIPDKSKGSDSGNFIPDHIYTTQSQWYSVAMQKYGLPLDSRHFYTKSDWEFQAAAVAGKETRAQILDRVAKWLNETNTDRPFTDLYETEGDGGFPGPNFFARPVIGSHYAFLTLERACGGRTKSVFGY